jgi:hypothetical protein
VLKALYRCKAGTCLRKPTCRISHVKCHAPPKLGARLGIMHGLRSRQGASSSGQRWITCRGLKMSAWVGQKHGPTSDFARVAKTTIRSLSLSPKDSKSAHSELYADYSNTFDHKKGQFPYCRLMLASNAILPSVVAKCAMSGASSQASSSRP